MTRNRRVILIASVIGLAILASWAGWRSLSRRTDPQIRSQIVAPLAPPEGFARAEGPREFKFPADHGPHPSFQTEWWYYTGNLETDAGRRFGYQLTFFRRALVPPDQGKSRTSNWAADQVYMAHFAVTDAEDNTHRAFERFSRGAAGLAGAQGSPYRVWLEDWTVVQIGDRSGTVEMRAGQEDFAVDLRLDDQKGPILQGDRGYSRKGPAPGNASFYYSQTRLRTRGTVRSGGATFAVSGWSWMDHEFSTSALASDQVGWDWFALQFDDGTELMVFQIRQSNGAIDPYSSGTFIRADGSARRLDVDDFALEVGDTWRSPTSGSSYPSRWTIRVPSIDLVLRVEPTMANQELNVSYTYWEGAVDIEADRAGQPLEGVGYVELTGYASSMQEQF